MPFLRTSPLASIAHIVRCSLTSRSQRDTSLERQLAPRLDQVLAHSLGLHAPELRLIPVVDTSLEVSKLQAVIAPEATHRRRPACGSDWDIRLDWSSCHRNRDLTIGSHGLSRHRESVGLLGRSLPDLCDLPRILKWEQGEVLVLHAWNCNINKKRVYSSLERSRSIVTTRRDDRYIAIAKVDLTGVNSEEERQDRLFDTRLQSLED